MQRSPASSEPVLPFIVMKENLEKIAETMIDYIVSADPNELKQIKQDIYYETVGSGLERVLYNVSTYASYAASYFYKAPPELTEKEKLVLAKSNLQTVAGEFIFVNASKPFLLGLVKKIFKNYNEDCLHYSLHNLLIELIKTKCQKKSEEISSEIYIRELIPDLDPSKSFIADTKISVQNLHFERKQVNSKNEDLKRQADELERNRNIQSKKKLYEEKKAETENEIKNIKTETDNKNENKIENKPENKNENKIENKPENKNENFKVAVIIEHASQPIDVLTKIVEAKLKKRDEGKKLSPEEINADANVDKEEFAKRKKILGDFFQVKNPTQNSTENKKENGKEKDIEVGYRRR